MSPSRAEPEPRAVLAAPGPSLACSATVRAHGWPSWLACRGARSTCCAGASSPVSAAATRGRARWPGSVATGGTLSNPVSIPRPRHVETEQASDGFAASRVPSLFPGRVQDAFIGPVQGGTVAARGEGRVMMLASAHPSGSTRVNPTLAMTDRLLTEFDTLPIRTVVSAISAARVGLVQETGGVPALEQIETRARARLQVRSDEAR